MSSAEPGGGSGTSPSAGAAAAGMAPRLSLRYAYGALALLTVINVLNYLDRSVGSAVLENIKAEFTLNDTQCGLLMSVFLAVYLVASPIFGHLGDRWPRRYLIAASVALWSVATALGGMAGSFAALLWTRAAVGVGEAGYGPVSPALIADYFPPARRSTALSVFYAAIPIGFALGYLVGGWVGGHYGWRAAFYVVGLPGLAFAAAACFLREPPRGAQDGGAAASASYRDLLGNRTYWTNTAALAALTFVMGGLALWLPAFLQRERGLSVVESAAGSGLVLVIAGPLGTAVGGWLADRLRPRWPTAPLLVSGIGLLLGVPVCVLAALSPDPRVYWSAFFVAETLLFLNTGPLNAVIVSVTAPNLRARAFAINIAVIHALGDVLSPLAIGALSTWLGLTWAFLLTAPVIGLSGILCLVAMRTYAADVRAAGGDPTPRERPTAA